MTTRPIVRPKLDIVKLAGANGVTEDETIKEIKALELKIHRETKKKELPDEIQPLRDDLVRVPRLGHQGALELLAHMGMFISEFDKANGNEGRERRCDLYEEIGECLAVCYPMRNCANNNGR